MDSAAHDSTSPPTSMLFLPLGRQQRNEANPSRSADLEREALDQALNSIHNAASQSQVLTVFNEYTDPPPVSSQDDAKSLAGDIQGGLSGLYQKIRATVGGTKDGGETKDAASVSVPGHERSLSKNSMTKVPPPHSPRGTGFELLDAAPEALSQTLQGSVKPPNFAKATANVSLLKSPALAASTVAHFGDPALTELNIHANRSVTHSRTGSSYDNLKEDAKMNTLGPQSSDSEPLQKILTRTLPAEPVLSRSESAVTSPVKSPKAQTKSIPPSLHLRDESDVSIKKLPSTRSTTRPTSPMSFEDDAPFERITTGRPERLPVKTRATNPLQLLGDHPSNAAKGSSVTSPKLSREVTVTSDREGSVKRPIDKGASLINQSRLPSFVASRPSSTDSGSMATNPSKVQADGQSTMDGSHDVRIEHMYRPVNKLRSKLLNKEFWMRDENARDCFRCGEPFTTFRRKHHCRTCGQIFDNKCTVLIRGAHFGSMGAVRVCKPCEAIILSHEDDSSDYSADDMPISEPGTRPRTPESSTLPQFSARFDDDNVSVISQSLDQMARTPTMSFPVRRAYEAADRSSRVIEFEGPDRPLPRPSSSRSLKTAHSISHGHKRHHSRQQYIRNFKAYHDDRAPFQRRTMEDIIKEPKPSAFHRDSIIDPDLAQYLSDEASSDDNQSISMTMHQEKDGRGDEDKSGISGLLAAVKKGRTRLADRSIAGFLYPARDTDSGSVVSSRGPDGSRRKRNLSVASSTHQRMAPRANKDRLQVLIAGSRTDSSSTQHHDSKMSRVIRSASMHGLGAPAMELNRASIQHVHKLLQQLLKDANIAKPESWEQALVPILLRATDDVDPDVQAGDDIDIRNYVKLKKIPGGRPGDTTYISGLIFTKNVALKSMPRSIIAPRILIVAFAIEYSRQEQHFMSLDPVIRQEGEYLANVVNRIAALKPDLLLAQRNISGLALDLLEKAGITTIFNVKSSVLDAVSRCTQTRIVHSMDKLGAQAGQLGFCESFEIKTYVSEGRRKNYVYLSGCPPQLGCTIALRGGDRKTLMQIKRITEFMIYVVYNLKLETCLMRDEWALIPTNLEDVTMLPSNKKAIEGATGPQKAQAADEKKTEGAGSDKASASVPNAEGNTAERPGAVKPTSTIESDDSAEIPDDIPVPVFYEDMANKHQTKILSASPFVKFMQPYLLMRAREYERRVAYLKRLRDRDLSAEHVVDEKSKAQKFTLIQPEMLHASLAGTSKKVREIIHAVHDAEYDKAMHNYETQKKQWEAYLAGTRNLFDPYAHQNIVVQFSFVSTATSVPCSGPDLLAFSFYNEHDHEEEFEADCTLGQYVEDLCYRANEICTVGSCEKKMYEHHRQYVHGEGQITVFVQPHPAKLRGLQHVILMWSQCRICGVETTVTPMSPSTWKYSFGKYLELSFWCADLHARASACPHDLHRDHVRYFGYKDFALSVHYDPVDLLEIIVPRLRITWKVDNDLRFRNDVFTRIEHRITRFMSSVKLRLKSINVDTIIPENAEACRTEIDRLTKRANEEHTALIKLLQERYTNSKHWEILPLNKALRLTQEKVAEWDNIFSEFELNFFPSEKDIRRLATLQLKKIILDRDASVTSFTAEPEAEGTTTPPVEEVIDEKAGDLDEARREDQAGQMTILSPEKTESMLRSVVEEHSSPAKAGEEVKGQVQPDESMKKDQARPDEEVKDQAQPDEKVKDQDQPGDQVEDQDQADEKVKDEARADIKQVVEELPHVHEGPIRTEDVKHLDLAIDDAAVQISVPSAEANSSQAIDAPLPRKPLLHTDSTATLTPLNTVPTTTNEVAKLTNTRRAEGGRAISPTLLRAHSQPAGPHTLRREGQITSSVLSAATGFGSGQSKAGHLLSSSDGDHGSIDKKLSGRLGLAHIKHSKFVKGHSFIPRAISTRKDSHVSNLAKHFEQLSREFERERVRERKMRAARSRQSRVYPLAASRPIVEVYKDVDEAVEEQSSSDDVFEVRGNAEIEPSEAAPAVEGMSEARVDQAVEKIYPAEETPAETTETDIDLQLSTHAASDVEDHSEEEEDIGQDIYLPDSPEDLLRLSQEDIELKELQKHERSSLMKILTNFWAERSSSGWAPLEYPLGASEHVFADCDIIVREDEPSSVIAFALASQDYKTKLCEIQDHAGATTEKAAAGGQAEPNNGDMQTDLMHSLLRKTGTHLKYQFAEGPAKMLCKIFFAEQFDAVRRKCGVADRFVESLSRCAKWDSKGGKTKSLFLKTLDGRFILKSLSPVETQSFLNFAPNYFQIMSEAFFHELPSVIAKMLGFYQIIVKNSVTGAEYNWYLLVMENLFYDRVPTRIFDLKGSMRNRKIEATGERNEVLLDENMVEFIYESPLFAREHSKKLLRSSVHNDTLFLARQNVMDYSLMIAIDEVRKELVVGIIDCIRTYTWDKKLESWIKDRGFAGGGKNRPTVTSPREYKLRFREAMSRYVLEAPNCWHQFRDGHPGDADEIVQFPA
ncbi:hypothetical protein DV738_g3504, partial [Chaetothyriales sp. CBS 135597]